MNIPRNKDSESYNSIVVGSSIKAAKLATNVFSMALTTAEHSGDQTHDGDNCEPIEMIARRPGIDYLEDKDPITKTDYLRQFEFLPIVPVHPDEYYR